MESEFIIVGAGIGGLAAALALSRHVATGPGAPGPGAAPATRSISLFEQADNFVRAGAGIQLGPNAVRLLRDWGLSRALDEVAARPERLQALDATDGRLLGTLRLGGAFRSRYGADYLTLHRADLQRLLWLALDCRVVHMAGASTVLSVVQDSTGVLATTLDGKQHRAAGLLACDGLWSATRQHLLQDSLPEPTGHVAYRAMLDIDDVPHGVARDQVTVWLGPGLHGVAYPVRRGALLNLVLVMQGPRNARVDAGAGHWDQDSDGLVHLQALEGLHPGLPELARAVPPDRWKRWTLHERAPLPGPGAMARGRIALLGDAAHPMRPYLAQGAAMALEDAQALARAVLDNPRQVAQAFRGYADARWRRNARVQRKSRFNGTVFHASGVLRAARNFAMRWTGERLLDTPWLYRP
jgi:salicylate hydroxylase